MSKQKIRDISQAMDCARKTLEKANVGFYTITSVQKENNTWLVQAEFFLKRYIIRIDANTGDILEYRTESI